MMANIQKFVLGFEASIKLSRAYHFYLNELEYKSHGKLEAKENKDDS